MRGRAGSGAGSLIPKPSRARKAMQAIAWRRIGEQAGACLVRSPLALALPLGALVGGLIYLCCRAHGYFGDEGSACTIAQGILQGKFPYQSYFNEKAPLQYFWTAAIMAISGPTLSGARLASTVTLTLTAICILRSALERARSLPVALGWALLIFLAAIDLSAYIDTAESTLAFLFSVSALLVVRKESGRGGPRLIAGLQGVIWGVAIGFRQAAIAPALVMLFLPNTQLPRRVYGAGLVLGIAGWLVPMIALGIGPDLFDSIVAFHFNNTLVVNYFQGPQQWSDRGGFLLWLLCFARLASLKSYRKNLPWLIVWFAAMALPAFGRMDAFRLWPSTAAMLVLIARAAPGKGLAARGPALAFLSIALGTLLVSYPRDSSQILNISNKIASMTRPDDRIWVGPSNPLAYCLAQRLPASRYYFILPWTAKADVRRQIVADITRTMPKLIVVDDSAFMSWALPGLLGLMAKNYHASGAHGGLNFYERNGAAR